MSSTNTMNPDLDVDSNSQQTQSNDGTDGADTSSRGIFEHEGKLAFIHHKKVTIISNFITSVASIFEASSVVGYIFDISSNQRQWQCALTLGQLCDSRTVLSVLQEHCQDGLWYRVPRDAPSFVDLGAYMFQQSDDFRVCGTAHHRQVATIYPAWQKCGSFVINDTIQINPKTKSLLQDQERYVLYQNSWKKGRGRGASDACLGSGIRIKQPFSANGIGDLLQAFKNLLTSNYPAACLTLGGTVMILGYQRISQAGGSCPVVLLTGDTETSKTTVLKACISSTGNSETKDYTSKKALERSKSCDLPFAWDDPSSKEDVKFIVQALFNQAGKDTVHSSGFPRSPPIISANFACVNDKRSFSRQAIILFERPHPLLPSQTMTERKSDLDKAAKKASTGLMEALCLVEKFIDISSSEDRQTISNRIETLFPSRIRSQDIYSKLMWFTIQVLRVAGMVEDEELVWSYMESKIAPFIENLFRGVMDLQGTESTKPAGSSLWTHLKFNHPLTKREEKLLLPTDSKIFKLNLNFHKRKQDGVLFVSECRHQRREGRFQIKCKD